MLRRLAEHHLFFDLVPSRPHPLPPLVALSLQAGAALAARAGAERDFVAPHRAQPRFDAALYRA